MASRYLVSRELRKWILNVMCNHDFQVIVHIHPPRKCGIIVPFSLLLLGSEPDWVENWNGVFWLELYLCSTVDFP